MAGANSLKSIIYALAANFAIAVAKLVAAAITGSGAMLAEGIHSLADCGNQLLLMLGLKRAKAPPTAAHPLGYGKSIYFWSFIVAIMLFSMGGLFSLYEGWHKLHAPEPLNKPWIAVGVLVFGIIVEGLSFAGCIREVNKERYGMSFLQWFRESRTSELVVIFGEDLAALMGLVVALMFILLAMVTGNPMFDAIGSMSIGALLLIIAVFIGVEVKALLIGQGVPARKQAAIHAFIEQQPGVEKVLSLKTLHLGAQVMVAVKAQMHMDVDSHTLVQNINACEKAMKAEFPEIGWSFFEPDVTD